MSYNSPFSGNVIQPTDVSYRAVALDADTTLSWPLNGNVDGNYAARIMNVTPATAGLSLLMPPANQTSVGNDSLVQNVGASAFTLRDYDGGTIVVVSPGESRYIYVTNNTTEAGVWGITTLGATGSGSDAATLAGYGLVASAATLNQSHPISAVIASSTFAASDRAQTKVWSGGAGTCTLPAATTLGNNWFTIFKNNGSGSFVISCTGAETIDGNTTKTFAPNEAAFIICDGAQYLTVGYGVSSQFVFTSFIKSVTSGSYTLTANEASNTIQEYVGNLSGNVTVTYPPIVNLYVVANQTTDNGYSLTITTGSGASATVPAGGQATLVCDGTNFFNANTTQAGATSLSLIDGSVSSPSLNFGSEPSTGIYRPGVGTLGVAVLGNDIMLATASGVDFMGDGSFTGAVSVAGSGTFEGGVAGGSF